MKNTTVNQKAIHRPIKILSPQLANQIAAGEVVERPASVVKELVENSLDANATEIFIDIEQGGQKRILIRDNGKGISKEELTLALSRHATSKITNIDDLEHITSMGFRGEALASISSVSRLTLTSKPQAQSEAWQAIAEGQQMEVEVKPAAHPNGTSIDVLDLFFNTPARRKFLRTGKTEFQHIENIIKRIALTRPDVQFVLSHNQKVHSRYLRVKELSKRIEQVCGKNMLLNCTGVDYSFNGIKISGWCSKLGHGMATRDLQYTFVNGRMMKDKLLAHALRQVYEETLPPQTFSSYVLFLEVSPEQIDVNVHPAKHEVRFHQARQVHDIVFKAINDAISGEGSTGFVQDDLSANSPSHNYIRPLTDSTRPIDTPFNRTHIQSSYRPNTPTKGEINANHDFYASTQTLADSSYYKSESTTPIQQAEDAPSGTGEALIEVQTARFLYSPPFVVLPQGECLQVLPVESLVSELLNSRLQRSTLAQPLLMPVSIGNKNGIKQNQLDELSSVHFTITVSHQKLILKQVPSELRHLPWASIFSQLPLDKHFSENGGTKSLANMVARAWLSALVITNSMLEAWLSEIGPENMPRLSLQYAKLLDLREWMRERIKNE
jgi:DNA mismatch repair protein MutL